jgi:hypothetical protein
MKSIIGKWMLPYPLSMIATINGKPPEVFLFFALFYALLIFYIIILASMSTAATAIAAAGFRDVSCLVRFFLFPLLSFYLLHLRLIYLRMEKNNGLG